MENRLEQRVTKLPLAPDQTIVEMAYELAGALLSKAIESVESDDFEMKAKDVLALLNILKVHQDKDRDLRL